MREVSKMRLCTQRAVTDKGCATTVVHLMPAADRDSA